MNEPGAAARRYARDALKRTREALPAIDELVLGLAMCRETRRVAHLARTLMELKQQIAVLDRALDEQRD